MSLGSLGKRARSNLDLALRGELDSDARRRVMKDCLHHAARVASEWARLSRLKLGGRSAARVWEWLEEVPGAPRWRLCSRRKGTR